MIKEAIITVSYVAHCEWFIVAVESIATGALSTTTFFPQHEHC
jgi:hypothetical protein